MQENEKREIIIVGVRTSRQGVNEEIKATYRVHINKPAHPLDRFHVSLVAILLVTALCPLVAVQSSQFISTQHQGRLNTSQNTYPPLLLVSVPPVS